MPSKFPETIRAQIRGATVRFAELVRFSFRSQESRLWTGFGPLVDNNGEQWEGIANLGALSAVSSGPGQAIEELSLTLFASDEMIALIPSDTAEVTGQVVKRYIQFFDVRKFDDQGNWVEWQPLDDPWQNFWGKMGAPLINIPKKQPDEGASQQQTITIRAANAFVNRRRPAFGYYSNRDQQARSPGDKIFSRVAAMASTTVRWPDL